MYVLAPSGEQTVEHAFWQNNFTDQELNRMREYGDSLPPEVAKVSGDAVDPKIRKTQISWMYLNDDSRWIYDRLAWILRKLNGQYFNYDLTGFNEALQYTVYGPGGDHYDWHMDKGPESETPRKLSMVLQLSDPSEYDGGGLELLTGPNPFSVPKEKGLVYVFPSYVMHRVPPVVRGVRRSIVVWANGPRFR